ncbi:MAG: hypothetical protein QTN59_12720 [Candidatus Electrothrix communis]|nr:MAG: hypothetical protein QTN59_12720 [Candidatus Electrothrix communis]
MTYADQANLSKAKPYISHAVQLAEKIGHPNQEEWRTALEDVRTKQRGGRPSLFSRLMQSLRGR